MTPDHLPYILFALGICAIISIALAPKGKAGAAFLLGFFFGPLGVAGTLLLSIKASIDDLTTTLNITAHILTTTTRQNLDGQQFHH